MIRVFIRPCGKTYVEEHAAAYELLYTAASLMGLKAGRVEKTDKGKPYFPDAEDTFFSISHGGGYAAVAIGERPCGLDIEADRSVSRRIREKFLDNASEDEAILRWTERESRGKLLGGGFFDTDVTEPVSFTVFRYDCLTVTLCTYSGTEVTDKIEELS